MHKYLLTILPFLLAPFRISYIFNERAIINTKMSIMIIIHKIDDIVNSFQLINSVYYYLREAVCFLNFYIHKKGEAFMKYLFLVVMAVFTVSSFAAETVFKISPQFPWPGTTGVTGGYSLQVKDFSFSYNVHFGNRAVIGLSWSLPDKASKGTISIFTLTGTKIKSFSINEPQGSVAWDISGGKKTANGLYFATLTSGTLNKNLQIFLSR
jgi:hypothetical protein